MIFLRNVGVEFEVDFWGIAIKVRAHNVIVWIFEIWKCDKFG